MPDSDTLKSAAAFIAFVLAGLWAYFRSPKPAPQTSSVLAGVGLELGNREQTERMIGIQTRIAIALEILADKRTDDIEEMHQALLERLDLQERREEQEEQRPRRMPVKRR